MMYILNKKKVFFFSKIYRAPPSKYYFNPFFTHPLARYTKFILMLTLVRLKEKFSYFTRIKTKFQNISN